MKLKIYNVKANLDPEQTFIRAFGGKQYLDNYDVGYYGPEIDNRTLSRLIAEHIGIEYVRYSETYRIEKKVSENSAYLLNATAELTDYDWMSDIDYLIIFKDNQFQILEGDIANEISSEMYKASKLQSQMQLALENAARYERAYKASNNDINEKIENLLKGEM